MTPSLCPVPHSVRAASSQGEESDNETTLLIPHQEPKEFVTNKGIWYWLWIAVRNTPANTWLSSPQLLGILYLAIKNQSVLRNNVKDATLIPIISDSNPVDTENVRTYDATGNDLKNKAVGGVGQPFSRNTFILNDIRLNEPSPDLVAEKLLTRHSFKEASSINLFVPAWIQFLLHDLFDHNEDYSKKLKVGKQVLHPTLPVDGHPHLYSNKLDHFLNGSQIYGSTYTQSIALRVNEGGKIRLKDDYLPVDKLSNQENIGHPRNIWFGLAMVQYTMVLEHNTIAEEIQKKHPDFDDEKLFSIARLVISALIAKIQAIEWTTAIIENPAGQYAQTHMLYGFFGQKLRNQIGTQRWLGNYINGILGGNLDYRGVNYATTEEFVSIYRLHSLLPEHFNVRDIESDATLAAYPTGDGIFENSHKLNTSHPRENIIYSMGFESPGALVLNNYPNFLRNLDSPGSPAPVDLAAVDIIRDRERGVPRYNDFRRGFLLKPIEKWTDLTSDQKTISDLKSVYGDDVESLDLLIGTLAEAKLPGFVFGETTYSVFVCQTQRRLECDRFLTKDYRPEVYTKEGIDWVENNTFASILRRHFPSMKRFIEDGDNAFFTWKRKK